MTNNEKKKELRSKLLKPKEKLRLERVSQGITTTQAAGMVGLERRQYELKEKGEYPFLDYEMRILSKALKKTITHLFFNH